MDGFIITVSEDGWLSWSCGEDYSRIVTPTTASAPEWRQRLIDAGLFQPHPDATLHSGELIPVGNRYGYQNYKRMEEDMTDLAGYWTDRGNFTDDFRDGIRDNDLEHLPYAALAWIDHEIREWAADHARAEVTWEGEVDGDIHKKAAEIIRDTRKRFDHENPACAMHEHGPQREAGVKASCTPGETRLYAFGDFEEAPIPLCRGCFHRQLARDGEAGRHPRYFLREGFLTLEQWEEADKPSEPAARFSPPPHGLLPNAIEEAAPPSVTAATSAALVTRYNERQEL